MRSRIAIVSAVIVTSILAALLTAYLQRERLINNFVSIQLEKQRRVNHLLITIGELKVVGIVMEFKHLTVVPEEKDSLLSIERMSCTVDLVSLLRGNIKLSKLEVQEGWLHLTTRKGLSNYTISQKKPNANGLGESLDHSLRSLLDRIPNKVSLTGITLSKRTDDTLQTVDVISAQVSNKKAHCRVRYLGLSADWIIDGTINSDHPIAIKAYAVHDKLEIPLLAKKLGGRVLADTISFSLLSIGRSNEILKLSGLAEIVNLVVSHPKIASGNVTIARLSLDARARVGRDFFEVDSTSTIQLNALPVNVYLKYTTLKPHIYALRISTKEGPAQRFFDALPKGAFESLEGIKVSGNLQYKLQFYLDGRHPDALAFAAGFGTKKFAIERFGTVDLSKINRNFLFTPIERGHAMRPRVIGADNPNYANINRISAYLRNAVVISEDPNFYFHRGIDAYAFRKVMIIDFKAHSFKRGGSTISMQLVKNVFLSREKTVSRKVEEMLITWLLESGITTKQRILETYLNLIEWAPDVYGIGEAAHFYFGKTPDALTLGESIFLTSIIPKPKSYRYAFNEDGSLKAGLRSYFRFIAGHLLQAGKIDSADTSSMFKIRLAGPAARFIIKRPTTDSSTRDSSKFNFLDNLISLP